jgi:peptidyl-prolyl cis-trans isomerase SurA
MIAEQFLSKKKQQTIENWVTEQQAKTYIRIDPTYANCNYQFKNWIK